MKKINLIMPIVASTATLGAIIPMVSCNKKQEEEKILINTAKVDSKLGEITYTGGLNKETVFVFNNITTGYKLETKNFSVSHGETKFIIGNKEEATTECYINDDGKGFTIKANCMLYDQIKVVAYAEEIVTDIDKTAFINAYTTARQGFDATFNKYNHFGADQWDFYPDKKENGSHSSGPIENKEESENKYIYCESDSFAVINNKIAGDTVANISAKLAELEADYDIVYQEGTKSIRYIATAKDSNEVSIKKLEVVYDKTNTYLVNFGIYEPNAYPAKNC